MFYIVISAWVSQISPETKSIVHFLLALHVSSGSAGFVVSLMLPVRAAAPNQPDVTQFASSLGSHVDYM